MTEEEKDMAAEYDALLFGRLVFCKDRKGVPCIQKECPIGKEEA